MKLTYSLILLLIMVASSVSYAEEKGQSKRKKAADWNQQEYSGSRTEKDRQTALLSKGFTWLTGSPADNEVLSVGKVAQFFGFVALRYESGRAAKRGNIGKAFYTLATPEQRRIMLSAVQQKEPVLEQWWQARSRVLDQLEASLYTGQDIDYDRLKTQAATMGWLNAKVALIEAEAIAAVEKTLTEAQWHRLSALRKDPDLANAMQYPPQLFGDEPSVSEDTHKRYEDQFAKGFSWLTGRFSDREIIPKGQPAQFFGFVAIRHQSGHGASRGKIAKRFKDVLEKPQKKPIQKAVIALEKWETAFFDTRRALLQEMEGLRSNPARFDQERYFTLAKELGVIEVVYGTIEAEAYKALDQGLSTAQRKAMADIRADYVVDERQVEDLTQWQRGEQLMTLCHSCHDASNKKQTAFAPPLTALFTQTIASENFSYSRAMQRFSAQEGQWTASLLDRFLADPQQQVPGTTMAFKGLQNEKDRQAVIAYLKGTASP